jgi:phosphate transport system permease protein
VSRPLESVGLWALRALTYSIVAAIALVLGDIVVRGAGAITPEFLTTMPRKGGAEGGILPAIVGTFWLVVGTTVVALPLGMGAAIYLSEYAREGRFTRLIRLGIVTLFVVFLDFDTSLLAGCLTLALMILPVIIVSSEEALRAVPQSLRDGSLALGATRWQTIWHNVLPYGLPGMLTGSILGIARAAGETAPILLTAVAFYRPRLPGSVLEPVMALPYHLYILATQHPDAAAVRPEQYGTALVLVVLVLGVNLGAILLRNRFRKKHRW